MKRYLCAILLIAAPAIAQPPDPDAAGKKKIIEDARAKALGYLKELPDFVCTQLTLRNIDPKGTNQWRKLETTNEMLTFAKGREEYRLMAVNGQKPPDQSHPADSMSLSDFANMLNWTFDPKSAAEISWTQWGTLRGHRTHVLAYKVPQDHSRLQIGKAKGPQVTVGYIGVINVDSESGAILSVAAVAGDIPVKFPLQSMSEEFNWEATKLGDRYFMLPQKSEFHSKEGKSLFWNETEFRECRLPGTESSSSK